MAPAAFDQDPRSDETVEYEPTLADDGETDAYTEFNSSTLHEATA
jgi:hypothetical protein